VWACAQDVVIKQKQPLAKRECAYPESPVMRAQADNFDYPLAVCFNNPAELLLSKWVKIAE